MRTKSTRCTKLGITILTCKWCFGLLSQLYREDKMGVYSFSNWAWTLYLYSLPYIFALQFLNRCWLCPILSPLFFSSVFSNHLLHGLILCFLTKSLETPLLGLHLWWVEIHCPSSFLGLIIGFLGSDQLNSHPWWRVPQRSISPSPISMKRWRLCW